MAPDCQVSRTWWRRRNLSFVELRLTALITCFGFDRDDDGEMFGWNILLLLDELHDMYLSH